VSQAITRREHGQNAAPDAPIGSDTTPRDHPEPCE